MMDKVCLWGPVLSLQSLFSSNEFSKGWWDKLKDDAWEEIPGDDSTGACPSHDFCKFAREEDDIEGGLREVGVNGGEGIGPLLDVGSETLIGIADAAVQIAQLVKYHVP